MAFAFHSPTAKAYKENTKIGAFFIWPIRGRFNLRQTFYFVVTTPVLRAPLFAPKSKIREIRDFRLA